ncbi:MAG: hypothetical protein SGPRY_008780 [Prymnesium sp.]
MRTLPVDNCSSSKVLLREVVWLVFKSGRFRKRIWRHLEFPFHRCPHNPSESENGRQSGLVDEKRGGRNAEEGSEQREAEAKHWRLCALRAEREGVGRRRVVGGRGEMGQCVKRET